MTLATDILADLETMMEDWDDAGAYNGAAAVSGIFDSEYEPLAGVYVGSAKPAFLCKTADIPAAAKGGVLVVTSVLNNVSAVSYTVLEAQPNPADGGPGTTRLILKKT